jgi:hypothetical protein
MTSPGQDNEKNMAEFVKEFGWPGSMIHAIDENSELWSHFGVRFRGTWIMVDDEGRVLSRSVGHIPKDELTKRLDQLIAE